MQPQSQRQGGLQESRHGADTSAPVLPQASVSAEQTGGGTPIVEGDDEARERRLQALHNLFFAVHGADGSPDTLPTRRHLRWRGGRAVILVALALLVVGGVVAGPAFRAGPSTDRSTHPAPSQFTLNDLPGSCPERALFSPNGRHLAIVMHRASRCDSPDPALLVALCDRRDGHLEAALDPQALLAHVGAPRAVWTSISWSPDSARLVFTIEEDRGDGSFTPGLLLEPEDQGEPQLERGTAAIVRADNQAPLWDMRAGVVTGNLPIAEPPASAYRWTADGRLTGMPSATAVTGELDPADGDTVSLWRTGMLLPVARSQVGGGPDRTRPPSAYVFASSGPLWSADGHFLASPLTLATLVVPPANAGDATGTPDADACRYYPGQFVCGTPPLPSPDAGFTYILEAVAAGAWQDSISGGPKYHEWTPATLAWRPDGRVLATILPGDSTTTTLRVTLIDAHTGATLARLTAPQHTGRGGGQGADYLPLAWSRDGKQLAFCDFASSRVTIWQGKALPA